MSVDLSVRLYEITNKYPKEERIGLVSQIRRASVSIASNIAESASRQTRKEYIQFLYTARGSLSEIETQIEISKRVGYIGVNDYKEILTNTDEIGKMLTGLINRLKGKG